MAMSLRVAVPAMTLGKNTTAFPNLRFGLRSFRPFPVTAAAAAATESGKREPRGIMKPKRVSEEMQDFLGGVAEIPRTQALKLIWAHIKEHDLQILCYQWRSREVEIGGAEI